MSDKRLIFLKHVSQTSGFPMIIDVEKTEGMYIYEVGGKVYMDLDSGFSVSSLGHRHPEIIKAIHQQCEKYLHTSVYGEHIQTPQVEFAHLLANYLNNRLDSVFFANGGSEATEIAIKASRKFTGRHEIISARNAYHGSTLGAESLRSDYNYTSNYLPGLPGVRHIEFNSFEDLEKITNRTAAVILEPVQAEAGVIEPVNGYLNALRKKCTDVGCLLVFDEIQTGFGRTGELFAFQKYQVEPDLLLIAKAMGGGMPSAACVSRGEIMKVLSENPSLGHINTFGGHPVCTAAAVANLKYLIQSDLIQQVSGKETLFKSLLVHKNILEVKGSGLLLAVRLRDKSRLSYVVDSLKEKGFIVNYFLFCDDSFRVAPPLIIDKDQIKLAASNILEVLDSF